MPLGLSGGVASSGVDSVGSDVLGSGTMLSLRVVFARDRGVRRVEQVEGGAVPRLSTGGEILHFEGALCQRLLRVVREIRVDLNNIQSASATVPQRSNRHT
jgi:hypothetical protein